MRMGVALATGSGTLLLLAGCASIPLGPPPVREVATVFDTMSCPDPMLNPLPGSGLVPEDFEVVAVLECANGVTRDDADGVIAGNEVRRYEGDLTEFLEAMAAPSDPGPAAVCSAVGYGFRAIWATDAAGRFVPMSFPSTACGGPKEDEPLAALARLEIVDRTFSAAGRVELHDATAAGCATRAGVAPLEILGWAPAETPPAVEDHVFGAVVCVYQADAADALDDAAGKPTVIGDGGLFAAAFSLDAPLARVVLTAAAGPGAARDCGEAASPFVVLHPRTETSAVDAPVPVTVELDGCVRIIGTDFQARPAPPEVVALLVGSHPAS